MQDLAEQVVPGVSAQAISKYERGKMMPSARVLAELGRALDTSLDFLVGGKVHPLRGVEFRAHAGATAKDRAAAEARVIEQLDARLSFHDILGGGPRVERFDPGRRVRVSGEEAVEEAVDALRARWNLGTGPILSVTSLLERAGVNVIDVDLPRRIEGLVCRAKREDGPDAEVVVVTTRTSVERRRLTISRELARRVVRTGDALAFPAETAMNRFAMALLVPRAHLLRAAGTRRMRLAYSEVIWLKHLYGVPAAAMLVRLGEVGVLPLRTVAQAFRTFARPWRRVEPDPLGEQEGFAAFERSRRLERLVWHAVAEELISPERAASVLGVSVTDIDRGTRGPLPARAAAAGPRSPLPARRANRHRI